MCMPDEPNHERGAHGRGTIMRDVSAKGEAYRARSSLAQRGHTDGQVDVDPVVDEQRHVVL